MSTKVYSVIIIPANNHRFWEDIFTYVCSSQESVVLTIIKYLKDFYNFSPSSDEENEIISNGMDKIEELFYYIVKQEACGRGWRLVISENELY